MGAFFDLLDWPHEYEPLDLNRWMPDFLLFPWQHSHAASLVQRRAYPTDLERRRSWPAETLARSNSLNTPSIPNSARPDGVEVSSWSRFAPAVAAR